MKDESANKPLLANVVPRDTFLITIWIFFTVTSMLLVCRLFIRLWLHRKLFWDDVFAILAYFSLLTHNVLATLVSPAVYMLINTYYGAPKPADFVDQVTYLVRLLFAGHYFFLSAVYLVKASILALLWRLVKNLSPYRRAWWGVTIVVGLSYLISCILPVVSCTNLKAYGCISPSHIHKDLIVLRFTTASDIVTDVMIMGLPIAFIISSYLPLPQKLGLVGLFTLGFAIIALSILRIVAIDNRSKHPPPSWLLFWSGLEASVAVMVSCFAAFKSLLTLSKRPSAYHQPGSSYMQSKGTRSGQADERGIALHSRSRPERPAPPTRGDMNTVVISSEGEDKKWDDGDSREEILQRTEFEVKFEQAPPGFNTPQQRSRS